MAAGTGIEWTEATWNPVVGCTRASEGCDNCYAVKLTHRLEAMGQSKYAGLTVLNKRGDRHFNGVVRTDEEALTIPLRWRKPRRVFVNSMSDLFHRDVPREFIARVWGVMGLCQEHTFQVLTKRPDRMADIVCDPAWKDETRKALLAWIDEYEIDTGGRLLANAVTGVKWPLPNVWLGTSVENQEQADKRIPHLLRCPAAVRFLSAEPLLSAIHLRTGVYAMGPTRDDDRGTSLDGIGWVIVGCESKPGKALGRFADGYADASLNIIDQCAAAGVPVFHKQMPIGRKACGDMAKFPERWRVREFPAALEVRHGE